jgi:hypothetical protein
VSPDQQGGLADGGNGHKAQSSDAVSGNAEAAALQSSGATEEHHQSAPVATFSSEQNAGGGENAPGHGAESGASAEVLAETLAALPELLLAEAPVREGSPVELSVNAGSTERALALTSNDLVALVHSTGTLPGDTAALPNVGQEVGALPGANVLNGNVYLIPLLREALPSAELTGARVNNPSAFSQFLDGDGAFLELWDRDQLLFPDSLPKMDEMQFPGGLPWGQEMPLPDRAPNLGGPLSRGEQPVEPPILASAVGEAAGSAPALLDGQEAVAAAAPAASLDSDLALASPDANRAEVSPADPTGAPADRLDTDRGEDPLRPYKIALGLLPFLPAFGFTAVTLREQVLVARRRWHDLRGRRGGQPHAR